MDFLYLIRLFELNVPRPQSERLLGQGSLTEAEAVLNLQAVGQEAAHNPKPPEGSQKDLGFDQVCLHLEPSSFAKQSADAWSWLRITARSSR